MLTLRFNVDVRRADDIAKLGNELEQLICSHVGYRDLERKDARKQKRGGTIAISVTIEDKFSCREIAHEIEDNPNLVDRIDRMNSVVFDERLKIHAFAQGDYRWDRRYA